MAAKGSTTILVLNTRDHTWYLSFQRIISACKKSTKKCVNMRQNSKYRPKRAEISQHFASSILRSTPAWKKYTAAGGGGDLYFSYDKDSPSSSFLPTLYIQFWMGGHIQRCGFHRGGTTSMWREGQGNGFQTNNILPRSFSRNKTYRYQIIFGNNLFPRQRRWSTLAGVGKI